MKKKRYSRILAYTLCLSLLATGCGKSAEDVTDYGSKQTEAENGSKEHIIIKIEDEISHFVNDINLFLFITHQSPQKLVFPMLRH